MSKWQGHDFKEKAVHLTIEMYWSGPARKVRHLARGIQQKYSSLPNAARDPKVKQGTWKGALTFLINEGNTSKSNDIHQYF